MKKLLSISLAVIIALSAVFLSGCEDKKKTETKPQATKAQANVQSYTSDDLKTYLNSFVTGNNPLYGTWKIKGINAVSYIFRNDGYGQMVMGSEADFAELNIDVDKNTLNVAFVLGINGTYNYKLSDDGKVLTLTSGDDTYTLLKQKAYNLVPKAPKNPKIDKNLLGWWQSEGNIIYFFADDGLMYSNNITMETCYTYNAEKGKINAVYDYSGDVKINLSYSYKNDKLTIDGNEYIRFTPDVLT